MTAFLLELRSEEIPARMQAKAREDLSKLFAAELAKAGLTATGTTTYATPRRLTLIARDLPDATEATAEELKGPRASAPPQALEGFLRKTGLTQEQLVDRDGVYYAVIDKPGRATADVLAEAIPAIVRAFPWPKSMRWGDASISTESPRWVRPLQGIVALFGDAIVPCEVAGVTSGAATVGHRFHHPGVITIGSASDYVEKLHDAHVIVDQNAREMKIIHLANRLVNDAGLTLIHDEGLVAENAGLTEWPVPLLGRFDADFLSVPPEVIQLTARVNQKYFVCNDADGKLANAFVCVANIDAKDGGAKIVEGNRKVLAARLSDARFFYETDLRTPLEEQAKKLEKIVFHEKLGTVADKVDRVAKLARWLVEEGIVTVSPSRLREGLGEGLSTSDVLSTSPTPTPPASGRGELATLAERAARLAKADLVTGMVGDFPELQGIMGGYYAAAQGEDPQVAAAIRDHYKPVGQGDDVPTDPVTVAVSLADKLDTLLGFFARGIYPTGSRDPFALRRAAIGLISIITANRLRIELEEYLFELMGSFFSDLDNPYALRARGWIGLEALRRDPNVRIEVEGQVVNAYRADELLVSYNRGAIQDDEADDLDPSEAAWDGYEKLLAFLIERLKVQQKDFGVRFDMIDAGQRRWTAKSDLTGQMDVEYDLVRLLARVHALQAFVATPDGTNLLAGYKRAANILKKENWSAPAQAGALASEADANPALRPAPEHDQLKKQLSYMPEPAEEALISALDSAEPTARTAVAGEDFEGAMAALATLRQPIDAFFESVTVNDADPAKRDARLALLARMRDAVHAVADFSKIEG